MLTEWSSVSLSIYEQFVFNQFHGISIFFCFLHNGVHLFSCLGNLFGKLFRSKKDAKLALEEAIEECDKLLMSSFL